VDPLGGEDLPDAWSHALDVFHRSGEFEHVLISRNPTRATRAKEECPQEMLAGSEGGNRSVRNPPRCSGV